MKKIFDIIVIIGIIIAVGVGIITAKGMRQTADKQIEAKSEITFEVFLRSVTISSKECPIKVGDNTFISIRNVPYTDLEVTGLRFLHKKTVVQANNKTDTLL